MVNLCKKLFAVVVLSVSLSSFGSGFESNFVEPNYRDQLRVKIVEQKAQYWRTMGEIYASYKGTQGSALADLIHGHKRCCRRASCMDWLGGKFCCCCLSSQFLDRRVSRYEARVVLAESLKEKLEAEVVEIRDWDKVLENDAVAYRAIGAKTVNPSFERLCRTNFAQTRENFLEAAKSSVFLVKEVELCRMKLGQYFDNPEDLQLALCARLRYERGIIPVYKEVAQKLERRVRDQENSKSKRQENKPRPVVLDETY